MATVIGWCVAIGIGALLGWAITANRVTGLILRRLESPGANKTDLRWADELEEAVIPTPMRRLADRAERRSR